VNKMMLLAGVAVAYFVLKGRSTTAAPRAATPAPSQSAAWMSTAIGAGGSLLTGLLRGGGESGSGTSGSVPGDVPPVYDSGDSWGSYLGYES
jgi:hypothetical protein